MGHWVSKFSVPIPATRTAGTRECRIILLVDHHYHAVAYIIERGRSREGGGGGGGRKGGGGGAKVSTHNIRRSLFIGH